MSSYSHYIKPYYIDRISKRIHLQENIQDFLIPHLFRGQGSLLHIHHRNFLSSQDFYATLKEIYYRLCKRELIEGILYFTTIMHNLDEKSYIKDPSVFGRIYIAESVSEGDF